MIMTRISRSFENMLIVISLKFFTGRWWSILDDNWDWIWFWMMIIHSIFYGWKSTRYAREKQPRRKILRWGMDFSFWFDLFETTKSTRRSFALSINFCASCNVKRSTGVSFIYKKRFSSPLLVNLSFFFSLPWLLHHLLEDYPTSHYWHDESFEWNIDNQEQRRTSHPFVFYSRYISQVAQYRKQSQDVFFVGQSNEKFVLRELLLCLLTKLTKSVDSRINRNAEYSICRTTGWPLTLIIWSLGLFENDRLIASNFSFRNFK